MNAVLKEWLPYADEKNPCVQDIHINACSKSVQFCLSGQGKFPSDML
jgi:hypothetical protein